MPGASPIPATRRGRLRSRAPGSQGAAFRNAGALGEARTRRSRGARRRGGVQAARASSRSRSHPPPGSASLFSPHFGTGLRRCRAIPQGRARRAARPAPPATGRPRRPDAAPDTPPRAAPGRPLGAFAPRLSRLRIGLAEGAPGIGAAAAAPVAVARHPRAPPRYRRKGRNPARVRGGQPLASCSGRPRPQICNTVGEPMSTGHASISPCVIFSNICASRACKHRKITHGGIEPRRHRPEHARSRDSDRAAKPQRAWAGGEQPGRRSDAGCRAEAMRAGQRRRPDRTAPDGPHRPARRPQGEALRSARRQASARGGEPSGPLRKTSGVRCAAKQASNPWPEVANAGGTARRGCPRG